MILLACLFSRIQNGRLALRNGIRPDRLMRLLSFLFATSHHRASVSFKKQVSIDAITWIVLFL
jgi:uncharacterized membrane protein YGL010W